MVEKHLDLATIRTIIKEEIMRFNESGFGLEGPDDVTDGFDESTDDLRAQALSLIDDIAQAVNSGHFSSAADSHYELGLVLTQLAE